MLVPDESSAMFVPKFARLCFFHQEAWWDRSCLGLGYLNLSACGGQKRSGISGPPLCLPDIIAWLLSAHK